MLRTIVRYTLKSLLFFIAVVALYTLAAFTLPYIKTNRGYVKPTEGITIFVESNGVHTDFVLPVKQIQKDWSLQLPYTDFESVDSGYTYVSMGWGDKGFFLNTPTWSDLSFSTAFKAAFGLSTTAMHVTYKRGTLKESESCRKLVITPQEYETLIAYIETSFQQNNAAFIAIPHPGYSDQDCFYEAKGTYSLFNTCNVWTGEGLKRTGIKIGIWTPFESGIINHLD